MQKKYWLLKCEPSVFSIDDLIKRPGQKDMWEGVRNYQARNTLRDEMKKGDLAFFYHSNSDQRGIYGIVEVCSSSYPDPTALIPGHKYYDPKSTVLIPIWYVVDVKFKRKFKNPITLSYLKSLPGLEQMALLQKGSRLSVQKVSSEEWAIILGHTGEQSSHFEQPQTC